MSYLSLNLKPCKIPDDGISWYNLDTNRRVTKINGKVGIIDPPVVASNWSIIAEFVELNDIHPDRIKYMNERHRGELVDAMVERLNPHVSMIEANDVEDVPTDVLSSLDVFSFSRISTKARVVKVIDGDTIDVAIILRPQELCVSHWNRRDREMSCTQSARICGDNSAYKSTMNLREFRDRKIKEGILMKLRLRLYGIDTAEKETVAGQRCKEWSILKYEELDNLVYVTLMGTDARGRTLANIYECPESNRSINQLLIDHSDPSYGKLCIPYYGATKNQEFVRRTCSMKRNPEETIVVLTEDEHFDPDINVNNNMEAWLPSDELMGSQRPKLFTRKMLSMDKNLVPDTTSNVQEQAVQNFRVSGSGSRSDDHVIHSTTGKDEDRSSEKDVDKKKREERCTVS